MMPVPRYIVLNENALGYVYDEAPGTFCILHASVLRGSPFDRLQGTAAFMPGIDRNRPATLDDFLAYRVCPRGHLA